MYPKRPKEIIQAEALIGGLSSPSKMPCYSFNIPAVHCLTGAKLRAVLNSVCAECYALKGRYLFGNVKRAMETRYQILQGALQGTGPVSLQDWTQAFVQVLRWNHEHKGQDYFRWHDSGDIQSVEHLQAIAGIAFHVPRVSFWLPTREKGIITRYLSLGLKWDSNLTVRLSAPIVGINSASAPAPCRESLVYKKDQWAELLEQGQALPYAPEKPLACPSSLQGNECLECRACWHHKGAIAYLKH